MTPNIVDIPNQGPIEAIKVKFDDDKNHVNAFLGIPFAQPPIGRRRWKRPEKPAPNWLNEGKIRKSEWQRDPFQPLDLPRLSNLMREDKDDDDNFSQQSYKDEHLMSEDCLYLNIWKPENNLDKKDLPILVWIYGGGFIFGSTSLPTYDGAKLANKTGCIVISISYRVSVFGFLGSRQLQFREGREGEFGTGNYGFLDIIAGLEWIQENIHVFGGDCKNVTAFGESAGAIALHYLMVCPQVPKGLFNRVALFSGTIVSVLPRTMPSAQATFDALLERLKIDKELKDYEQVEMLLTIAPNLVQDAFLSLPGIRPRSEYIVDPNKGRPKDRMKHEQKQLNLEPSSLCGPVWDGILIPSDILQRIESSAVNGDFRNGNQGIFLGHTADEGTLFSITMTSVAGLKRCMQLFEPEMRENLDRLYGIQSVRSNETAKSISSTIIGDYVFLAPVHRLTLDLLKQNKVPVYRYIWSHRCSTSLLRSSINFSTFYDFASNSGSWHSSELPFLFGNDGKENHIFARQNYPLTSNDQIGSLGHHKEGFTKEERKLSDQFIHHFDTFAKGKSPWKSIQEGRKESKGESQLMDFDIMGYDNLPSLGASTPEAMRTLSTYAEVGDEEHPIEIREKPLSSSLVFNAPVDPDLNGNIGLSKERVEFWTGENYKNSILFYYGDEKIEYLK